MGLMNGGPERRGDYGIDEPRWPALNAAVGVALLAGAAWAGRLPGRRAALATLPAVGGALCLGFTASYLFTTTRGKFAVWDELLGDLDLRGDETLLDMGCGRGAVLLMAARRLPRGRAIGVDLWRSGEQSGNRMEATRCNAEREGVSERVELHTGDMADLPLEDASADVVVSSLAIHNIPDPGRRLRALDEAVRVLRPEGRLAIADIHYATGAYAGHLRSRELEHVELRDLGWRFWYGGPFVATHLLTARKPAA